LAITCLLGWLMLVPFVVAGAGIAAATTPLYMPADSVVRTGLRSVGDVPEWALIAGSVLAVVLGILLGVLLTLAHRGLSAGLLRQSEAAGDYTARLALLEEQKSLPWQAVWEAWCLRHDVPADASWLSDVRHYEKQILNQR
ncbi:L-rhamnose isomerase, partial [Pantoea septica]|uniref:L-rhamnose isomerase n=1 Tax=Pantoea septica TaxID=472695 RepID=UPI0028A9C190